MAEVGTAAEGTISEGSAEILPVVSAASSAAAADAAPPEHRGDKDSKPAADQSVFYNPAQVFNRDLSTLVLNVFSAMRASEEKLKRRIWEEKDAKRRELPNCKPPSANFACPEYKGLSILEGLAASGLRSIRYWKEVKGIDRIVVNDLDPTAVNHIKRNLEYNDIPCDRVCPTQGDVNMHLYNNAKCYDVVDLDPYGTAAPFLDAAMVGIKNGGMLCVTSTDMPILGGNNPEVCFYRYGGTALKAPYVHEMSLRLLMNAVAMAAARHHRHVEPILSCSIDFYVRIFLRVHDTPVRVKELASKTGLVYQCCQCQCFHVQPLGLLEYGSKKAKRHEADSFKRPTISAAGGGPPNGAAEGGGGGGGSPGGLGGVAPAAALPSRYKVPKAIESIGSCCPECDGRYSIGGPFFLGSLYSKEFVDACLLVCDAEALEHVTSWKKITGMLTAISEEIEDIPLHYCMQSLCSSLRLGSTPLRQFKGTLQHLGYRVSHFHREPSAIKTDAPNSVVYDVLRKWAESQGKPVGCSISPVVPVEHGGKKAAKKQKSVDPVATKILEKAISTPQLQDLDFESMNVKDEERPRKVPRFLPNPEKFWGPKPRAKPTRPGCEGDAVQVE